MGWNATMQVATPEEFTLEALTEQVNATGSLNDVEEQHQLPAAVNMAQDAMESLAYDPDSDARNTAAAAVEAAHNALDALPVPADGEPVTP
jgi:hypothetical protein